MPRITKKELSERKVWFEQWKENLDKKLADWLKSLEPSVKQKLDYSIKSLSVIEELMLDTFETHLAIEDKSNTELFDFFYSYTGETCRKNHEIQMFWDCDFVNKESEKSVSFFPYLNSEYPNCSQSFEFAYTLYKRPGNDLLNRFKTAKHYFEENLNKYGHLSKDELDITPERTLKYFLFNDTVSNEKIIKSIKSSQLPIVETNTKQKTIYIKTNNGNSFYLVMNDSSHIAKESIEITENHPSVDRKIQNCNRRVELYVDANNSDQSQSETSLIITHLTAELSFIPFKIEN